MNDKLTLEAAIRQLDRDNDEHWTNGGMPSIPHLKRATGDDSLTREQVAKASNNLNRDGVKPGDLRPDLVKAKAEPDLDASDDPEVGEGNPLDAANNQERRVVQDVTGQPVYQENEDLPAATEIAEDVPNPILLLEAAVSAGMHGRYTRNSTLQTLLRGYQTSQAEIKATQARIDVRQADREEQHRAAERQAKERLAASRTE